ncbi:DNA methyltransferase [Kushneria phosphatilytica]|uniref:site-specific DNA-methyltransferase (cytosine-N(4)-specific) n=1 Tax=Kushneria phosphatilytica TaxID=657387 RepID=A0A1S1NYG9_9GAMM|nr:DNA methyltransferase [Kushneria phosphatilytica]OHV12792.1 DNA methyltransferase [Kushneria phosphatilytica]QEL10640.1 DNA methyltransferase [Kushneria phosphatilytica]
MLSVKQRSDYTFRFNKEMGRHGWLRLTPAYSVKLVQELVEETPRRARILEPFSGTATTGLCASESGMASDSLDINPFLVWFGNAKCAQFEENEIEALEARIDRVINNLPQFLEIENWAPKIHNIERWWCGHTLPLLCALRSSIVDEFGEPSENKYSSLAWISFCRLMIETSSADFNHVSMSFKDKVTRYEINQIKLLFKDIVEAITFSAKSNLTGKAGFFLGDSRTLDALGDNTYDHVITSPPYPNRMSYIRELRPYMYWTKFLNEKQEAGELDWRAIGGTWGTATSKLKDWAPDNVNLPESLLAVCEKILNAENKNAELMARYVHKYFYDMHSHFSSLRNHLNHGAKIDYIVGNSSFYGNLVDSEQIFESSLHSLGYKNVSSRIVRKRNSKKELYEFCVSATWNG